MIQQLLLGVIGLSPPTSYWQSSRFLTSSNGLSTLMNLLIAYLSSFLHILTACMTSSSSVCQSSSLPLFTNSLLIIANCYSLCFGFMAKISFSWKTRKGRFNFLFDFEVLSYKCELWWLSLRIFETFYKSFGYFFIERGEDLKLFESSSEPES